MIHCDMASHLTLHVDLPLPPDKRCCVTNEFTFSATKFASGGSVVLLSFHFTKVLRGVYSGSMKSTKSVLRPYSGTSHLSSSHCLEYVWVQRAVGGAPTLAS